MPVYALGEVEPRVDPTAYVHPDAVLIGDVTIGAEASVWPGAVLRGDTNPIRIGARTSVQDGSVVHVSHIHPTSVGVDCVIGHLVHLEGCTIEDGVLVGSGAVCCTTRWCGRALWWVRARWSRPARSCHRGPGRWACRPRSGPMRSTPLESSLRASPPTSSARASTATSSAASTERRRGTGRPVAERPCRAA
jgi:NDP-sugar pyrophosphorylase family protein